MPRFMLEIVATGEVRDADGNLLNQDVTAIGTHEVEMTEDEAAEFLERHRQT